MNFILNHLASITLAVLALVAHATWWFDLLRYEAKRGFRFWWRRLALLALTGLPVVAVMLESGRVNKRLPGTLHFVAFGISLGWSLLSVILFGAQRVEKALVMIVPFLSRIFGGRGDREFTAGPRQAPEEAVTRRGALRVARGAVYATPAVALAYGAFIERERFQLEEVDIPIPGLPAALDGLRLVQITDIHMGAFLSEREMERIVAMANETKAHLALMTGDLVTRKGDPVDVCLRQLGRVRADAGMIGCLGNHEGYADAEDYVTREGARRYGIRFLRSEKASFDFKGARLNFAGVDYQRLHSDYLVGAERLIEPGVPNILLSHNPDVLPVAASKGFDVTISGHTHGGQIRVEYLQQFVNPARFVTRFVAGLYSEGGKAGYVSRGLGTVGVPMRIGAPPELTLIRLKSVKA